MKRATHRRTPDGTLCNVERYLPEDDPPPLFAELGEEPTCPHCARGVCLSVGDEGQIDPRDGELACCPTCKVFIGLRDGRIMPHPADADAVASTADFEKKMLEQVRRLSPDSAIDQPQRPPETDEEIRARLAAQWSRRPR